MALRLSGTSTKFRNTIMAELQKAYDHKGLYFMPYAHSFHVTSHQTAAKGDSQNIPKLPVPKLKDTLSKYLKSVRPFLDEKDFAVTSGVVNEFKDGIGSKLHALLEKRAQKHENWLESWWLKTAYLGYRDPVVVYSSPGLVFPLRRFGSQLDQLNYAAKTISAALNYKDVIDSDRIPQEKMGNKPLDMAQYKKIFGTCRVPGENVDRLSYNSGTKHITVIHNNHIFRVDLWGSDGVRLSESQILEQLQKVVDMSPKPDNSPVGILTSEHRDKWAKAYALLVKDENNKKYLNDIERSIAVLCLDAPAGLWDTGDKSVKQTLAAAQTIHGNGSSSNGGNRWFDKTVQFIVGADGVTGLTYEHSPAEGQPIAVMTDFIIDYIEKGENPSEKSSSRPLDPIKFEFAINPEMTGLIELAKQSLDRLVSDLELNCFTFCQYGKNFIKSQKLSPDSYIQMAMQFAYYRLHNKPAAHYESAATRMFVGGRTETIRSCSVESVEFAKAMLSSTKPEEKLEAMKRAINSHKDYTVMALQGLGVDRHLLGLKLIAMENKYELPKLYTDKSFVKSTHMQLSTSQVACRCDGFMCYGPLVPDGYATCYNPQNNSINFGTASFASNTETSCQAYRSALEQSLLDMHDLLLLTCKSKSKL